MAQVVEILSHWPQETIYPTQSVLWFRRQTISTHGFDTIIPQNSGFSIAVVNSRLNDKLWQ